MKHIKACGKIRVLLSFANIVHCIVAVQWVGLSKLTQQKKGSQSKQIFDSKVSPDLQTFRSEMESVYFRTTCSIWICDSSDFLRIRSEVGCRRGLMSEIEAAATTTTYITYTHLYIMRHQRVTCIIHSFKHLNASRQSQYSYVSFRT